MALAFCALNALQQADGWLSYRKQCLMYHGCGRGGAAAACCSCCRDSRTRLHRGPIALFFSCLLRNEPAHFLSSLYLPPASSNSFSATFSPRNSCSSSLLHGHPSAISIFIIIDIWLSGIAGLELVSMPTMNCQ